MAFRDHDLQARNTMPNTRSSVSTHSLVNGQTYRVHGRVHVNVHDVHEKGERVPRPVLDR